jgi:hypothetical protein
MKRMSSSTHRSNARSLNNTVWRRFHIARSNLSFPRLGLPALRWACSKARCTKTLMSHRVSSLVREISESLASILLDIDRNIYTCQKSVLGFHKLCGLKFFCICDGSYCPAPR